MTEDQIRTKLADWIARVTGKTVIFAHEEGKRPALPYLMLNKTGSRAVRDHEQTIDFDPPYPDEPVDTSTEYPPVTASPVIEREWAFSLHAYAVEQPSNILRPLDSARRLEQMLEPEYPSLVVFDMSRIREVPEYVNEAWEPRANVDIFLRGLTRDGFVIDVINAIEPVEVGINRG